MPTVHITDAKAHLGELVAQVTEGQPVCITRHGNPVATLTAVPAPRRPISLASLQSLTDTMPMQDDSAGEFVRAMRDGDRY